MLIGRERYSMKNKICFTAREYSNQPGFIFMKKYRKRICVKEDAFHDHKYLDIVKFINNVKSNSDGDVYEK